MKKLSLWASVLALLVSAGVALAGELSDDSVTKLLDLSGTTRQVSAFPDIMKMSVEQARAQSAAAKRTDLSDADFKALQTALSDAFQPDPILRSVGAAVKKKVSDADAKQLTAWFESDLGKKITQAEVDAGTPSARQDMISNAQTLMADKKRVAFAHKLDKMLHATDDAMSFQERAATAMYSAVTRRLHPEQQVDVKALQQKIQGAMKQSRPNVETATVLGYVYAYRNIDMDSLNKYEKFLEAASTRRFSDASRAGLWAGMDQAVIKAADNIAAMAKK